MEVAFADLPSLAGRELVGDWFAVDASRLPLFDAATYVEENPFPLDGYPDDLVEGFHLVALLDHLLNRMLRVTESGVFAWNYGLDRVRFVSPVRAGQRMRANVRAAQVRPRGEGFMTLFAFVVEVEGRSGRGSSPSSGSIGSRARPRPRGQRVDAR